jgi:hypothetical protein|tara:strand:- start:20 stop:262 length:243 start_codon:yes stop_codon:yes gene_type:complete
MGVLDSELVNIDTDIKNAQAIKNTVLDLLLNNEVISEENSEVYHRDYQIIMIKKSWWHNWKDIFGKDAEPGYHYKFVKIN